MAKVDIFLIVLGSIYLDFLVGDPKNLIHPVQIIGFWITKISRIYLKYLKSKSSLIWGGLFIFLSTLALSYFSGKFIELKYYQSNGSVFWTFIIIIGISSCLATKSLLSSVKEISNLIGNKFPCDRTKQLIIHKVQRLVSRDINSYSEGYLLRSATESLTENSVDGIFGPLFWIFIGAFCMKSSIYLPGPLSLGFSYKAISTLDSMIGYEDKTFKYIGYFSAKIEDYVTFVPCRLVVLTLPLVSKKISNYFYLIKTTFYEGRKYKSPNSGISEGIFALIAGIKLGGKNIYRSKLVLKPILNYRGGKCTSKSIEYICQLIIRLQLLWIIIFSLLYFII